MPISPKRISVIYIAGDGRSGSTLLDRILGTLDGVSSFNEIYRVWEEGLLNNHFCPCGKRFSECTFWTKVFYEAFGKNPPIEEIWKLHNLVDHSRYFFRLFTDSGSAVFKKRVSAYREILKKLYFAIAKESGHNVIIDSSKNPSRPLILNNIPGISIYAVHLIRDLRAVVYSWQKTKFNPACEEELPQFNPIRSIFFWQMRNTLSELLAYKMPYLRIRYEDLTVSPGDQIQKLTKKINVLSTKKLSLTHQNTLMLEPLHSMGGNPTRFTNGVVPIRRDDRWRYQMSAKQKAIIKLSGLPLMMRYGYQ